jgi:hypothetical protein
MMARIALFLSVVLLASATLAQDRQDVMQDVVVTASPKRVEEIRQFLKTLARPTDSDQLVRFDNPICPAALGLSQAYNDAIVREIRASAQKLPIKVAPQKCDANLGVVFVEDSPAFLRLLKAKRGRIFAGMSNSNFERLVEGKGPIYAWHKAVSRDADGILLSGSSTLSASDGSIKEVKGSAVRATNSRITQATLPEISMALIVIELKAGVGKSVTQIADYALMRALTQTSRNDDAFASSGINSVLTLFRPAQDSLSAPAGLTAWDVAYIKALYATKNNVKANMQLSTMSRVMDTALEQEAETVPKK